VHLAPLAACTILNWNWNCGTKERSANSSTAWLRSHKKQFKRTGRRVVKISTLKFQVKYLRYSEPFFFFLLTLWLGNVMSRHNGRIICTSSRIEDFHSRVTENVTAATPAHGTDWNQQWTSDKSTQIFPVQGHFITYEQLSDSEDTCSEGRCCCRFSLLSPCSCGRISWS